MSSGLATLLWKELRQIPRKRSALLSAVLFPLLFFVVLPGVNFAALRTGAIAAPTIGIGLPAGMVPLGGNPALLMRDFMLPLVFTLGGLVVPAIAAAHTVITERERHTLELLVALPVSLEQIVLAKLLAVLLLALAISLPLFAVDAVGIIGLGLGTLADVAALLFLLVAALLYSTSSALLVSLLAGDYRTANNLNGAMLGPTILVTVGIFMLVPGGAVRVVALGGLFVVLAGVATVVALRALTIERFLR